VREVFDLTPRGIITALELRKPIYSATSAYGHFGRAPEKIGSGRSAATTFTWERTDRAAALKRALRSGAAAGTAVGGGGGNGVRAARSGR
jgi:S-adenosylmethionine synthetase